MNFRKSIIDNGLFAQFQEASIGLEKEGQRVTLEGHVSTTPHPQRFADRTFHPYIQTDYAESQLELITPVCRDVNEAHQWLNALHEVTLKQLPDNEMIWPMSMLAKLPAESTIKEAQMSQDDIVYREYLTQKYGKQKQMVSGIHFNFGFTEEFLAGLFQHQVTHDERNAVYMHVARNFIRYQWLLVYLFGTSISTEKAFFKEDAPLDFVRSLRTSRYGYVNDESIQVPYDSINHYAQAIRHYVETGQLIAEKEFYSSVRFRGQKSVNDFAKHGIKYVEFRLFDINPFETVGINVSDARFIQLFIMLMLWLDETNDVNLGQKLSQQTALQHPYHSPIRLEEGLWLIEQMLDMIDKIHLPLTDQDVVLERKEWLLHPHQTLGGQLVKALENQTMLAFGLQKATEYKHQFTQRSYGIQAFDTMELSTQALLEDAIINGLNIDILDANDQFIALSHKGHVEYVKNGNMTSHDSYISPLMMENKVVTKKVLEKDGFRVPKSKQIQTIEQAKVFYPLVKDTAIVIKPKSTNFGLGITIFKEPYFLESDFLQAIEIALKEDKEVMIEEYISGTEYRFFVIDNETKAVLLRVGANVVGDGVHTVEELVDMKNEHPLRGDGSKTPLKKIKIGEIETIQLKEQGYTKDSIIPKDVCVYLRANSNISTGGDSIDMTDKMHASYKAIAVGIAQAMYAKVCGVDLIIPDYTKAADSYPLAYGVIEANFNPMMMMHIYPAVGKSQRLTLDVLKMLFPEMVIK